MFTPVVSLYHWVEPAGGVHRVVAGPGGVVDRLAVGAELERHEASTTVEVERAVARDVVARLEVRVPTGLVAAIPVADGAGRAGGVSAKDGPASAPKEGCCQKLPCET